MRVAGGAVGGKAFSVPSRLHAPCPGGEWDAGMQTPSVPPSHRQMRLRTSVITPCELADSLFYADTSPRYLPLPLANRLPVRVYLWYTGMNPNCITAPGDPAQTGRKPFGLQEPEDREKPDSPRGVLGYPLIEASGSRRNTGVTIE
jgi:hypothetical protein